MKELMETVRLPRSRVMKATLLIVTGPAIGRIILQEVFPTVAGPVSAAAVGTTARRTVACLTATTRRTRTRVAIAAFAALVARGLPPE